MEQKIYNNLKAKYLIIFSHGAGAGMNHPFMENIADQISLLEGSVVRFNFPYMTKGRKLPGSQKEAIQAIGEMYDYARNDFPDLPIFLAGKSYGGRMSSHWIAENPETAIKGLIYLGFPLHAPGKDSTTRAEHLQQIALPQLFVQGTNDKLANFQLISEVVAQQEKAELYTVESGDHSFKVPKKSGKTYDQIMKEIAQVVNHWAIENC